MADPASMNEAVLAFLGSLTPNEEAVALFLRLYRDAPVDRLDEVLKYAPSFDLDDEWFAATSTLVNRLTATEDTSFAALGRAARDLAEVRPTEDLFRAARRLIQSGKREAVLDGIAVALSLGRSELLPDLVTLLDSLDAGLREKAREAIDAIVELKRLKEEAENRTKAAPRLTEGK
jgi:hypothetical protein